jgi:hypothetical protein
MLRHTCKSIRPPESEQNGDIACDEDGSLDHTLDRLFPFVVGTYYFRRIPI